MKSSCHKLISFLPLFCYRQFRRLDSIQFLCSQAHVPAGWRLETRLFFTSDSWLLSKSKLCYDRRSVGQSVLVSSTHLGLTTRFLLLSDSCGFVDVGRSLWRENGSAVYKCYWCSLGQTFLGPSPAGLVTIFTVSDSRLPQPGGQGPRN
jgi:hypothetical protein